MRSQVESWPDHDNRCIRFRGALDECELLMNPADLVERVRFQLISQIVKRLLDELTPSIDAALKELKR